MSETLHTIKQINTPNFQVTVTAEAESRYLQDELDEMDLDEYTRERLIDKYNSYELCYFVAVVTVRTRGGIELGSAALGRCMHDEYDDFKASGYMRDMVGEAIDEARRTLTNLKGLLS